MDAKDIVSWDPGVMGGELVFSGTTVPIKEFADYLKADRSVGTFLGEFPTVDREQVEGYIDLVAEILAEATEQAKDHIDVVVEITAEATSSGGDEVGSSAYGGPDGRRTHRLFEGLTEPEEGLASLSGHQALTPSKKGSGISDISRDHDRYLAQGPTEG